jgi:hypothetical protein
MPIDPDTALSVSVTLSYLLEPGWDLTLEDGGFRVTPPTSLQSATDLPNIVHVQAWKLSSGLAYWNFASIQQTSDGGFKLETRMKSGVGYYVIFALK